MFNFYLIPITKAFLSFPVAALLFTIPFLIVQYRRHGYINKLRGLLLYLFLLYLLNAVYLVILPFPASRHNVPPDVSSYIQWIPLTFIQDILRETRVMLDQPSTYPKLLTERAFLQVLFNVCITIPFGMFMRYYFRTNWLVCLTASFALSLFFEITQVTGIYGYFDYPYRLFDVDDLITNTLGGMLGFIIADWLSLRLPRIDQLDANLDLAHKKVSYTRRALAFLLDGMLFLPIWAVFKVLHIPADYFMAVALYFIILPYATNGRTFGKYVVRIRIKGESARIRLKELIVRNGLLYGVWGGLHVLFIDTAAYSFPGLYRVLVTLALFVLDGWLFFHVLIRLFSRNKKLMHEAVSRTTHVIT